MASWGDWLQDAGTAVVSGLVAKETAPSTPVATAPSGATYTEGQAAYATPGGIKPAYLIGGGIGLAALLLIVFVMRK